MAAADVAVNVASAAALPSSLELPPFEQFLRESFTHTTQTSQYVNLRDTIKTLRELYTDLTERKLSALLFEHVAPRDAKTGKPIRPPRYRPYGENGQRAASQAVPFVLKSRALDKYRHCTPRSCHKLSSEEHVRNICEGIGETYDASVAEALRSADSNVDLIVDALHHMSDIFEPHREKYAIVLELLDAIQARARSAVSHLETHASQSASTLAHTHTQQTNTSHQAHAPSHGVRRPHADGAHKPSNRAKRPCYKVLREEAQSVVQAQNSQCYGPHIESFSFKKALEEVSKQAPTVVKSLMEIANVQSRDPTALFENFSGDGLPVLMALTILLKRRNMRYSRLQYAMGVLLYRNGHRRQVSLAVWL
jgi:hypothetical protein